MKDFSAKFDEMRPYNDAEANSIITKIIHQPEFVSLLRYLYPNKNIETLKNMFSQVRTIDNFQTLFSSYAVKTNLEKTADTFTFSGLENLEKNKSYLFIANHRDIVMDAAIMQWLLKEKGFQTSQITFGSNLMNSDFIVNLGKLNKMFTFYRGGSPIRIYRNSLLHSKYIHHTIEQKRESIWIAQRDGRTKNGNDMTQKGVLKMFVMEQQNAYEALKLLHIVPVVISYELEPCINQKIQETFIKKEQNGSYTKKPNEDFNSIINGIIGKKGKVHLSFTKPLNHYLEENKELENVDIETLISSVCNQIDKQIYTNYQLYPFNYIAYDILKGQNRFLGLYYTSDDVRKFSEYKYTQLSKINIDAELIDKYFLEVYAYPVVNFLSTSVD